ncbi:MAG TPA: hypothetical protein VGL60_09840 [Acidimicrobiales bacterium]|jgi:hypothetical protein
MTRARRFGHFWWDFIVGDDWVVAVGVVLGISLTWLAADHGENWFWLMPVIVLSLLAASLRRATARGSDGSPVQCSEGQEVTG